MPGINELTTVFSVGLGSRIRGLRASLQAIRAEAQRLCLVVVSLGGELNSVEPEVQGPNVSGSDHEMPLRCNQFPRGCNECVLHDHLAVNAD